MPHIDRWELKEFIKKAVVDAVVILVLGAFLTYLLAILPAQARYTSSYAMKEVPPFFDTLPIYTMVAALLAMLGKLVGSLGSVLGAGKASVVAESVSGYIQGVTEEAEAMSAHGWLALLAGSAIAVGVSLLLSYLL